MGLFFGKKKAEQKQLLRKRLIEWQNFLMPDGAPIDYLSEQQLRSISTQQAENDLRIMKDCAKIIETTVKPDVFFMRLNLMVEKSKHLCGLAKYISFYGASPIDAHKEILENYQEAIRLFLIRYFSETHTKAESMKTDKGKAGKYKKAHDTIKEYFRYMNNENIRYIDQKFLSRLK